MIKSTVEVQISRIYGAESHQVEIRLMDKSSRVMFAEVHLPIADFATALFGQPVNAEIEYRGLNKLGTVHEVKVEFVECEDLWNKEARQSALVKHEVDGWVARHGDVHNPHHFQTVTVGPKSGKKGVKVVFFRNVGQSYVEQEQNNDSKLA